jgi:ATP-dependent Lon protease
MLQMPDGNTTVILQGKKRFYLKEEVQSEPYIKATIEPFKEVKKSKEDKEFKAMISSIKDMAMNIIQLSPNIPSEAGIAIRNIESTSFLMNFISSNMNADMSAKQKLLEVTNRRDMANMVLEHLTTELQLLN